MDNRELCLKPMLEVADLLRTRALSPVELLHAVQRRIEELDPMLQSYLRLCPESALAEAERAEGEIAQGKHRGALHGVPIGVKDLCDTAGTPTTCASRVFADRVPPRDATVVQRLREAGAVVVGKLNMTEFALAGYHPSLPIPRNPWDRERHAGASSSGSGVATAAGLCFGAIGTDTGGSIRGPSAWNGVVGLKPTYGRVSRYGVFPLAASLDHVGPMARRVGDAAAMFEVMAGFDAADPTSLRAPVPPCVATLGRGVRGLRVGYDDDYVRGGAAPDYAAAVEQVAVVLRDLGAEVVRVRLPSLDGVLESWFPLCAADALVAHADTYPSRAADYGPTFRSLLDYGSGLSASDYARAHEIRLGFAGALPAVFEQADVILCPGNFMVAPPAALIDPYAPFSTDMAPFLRYSGPFNFSGSPTLSLPCGFSDEGLPYGAQFVGRALDEPLLLQIGHAYERATEWHRRSPPV